MQFIVSGQRIAVENFVTGKLYTILFKTDTQVNLTCTSIGADCVVFQGESPFNLFTLTMRNADTIDTIEPTQLGTNNYNNLINKPQINGIDLIGNRTSSALGIREVPSIIEADDGKVLTAASDGTCSWEVIPEGTTDYTDLTNKPQIAGVTLSGNISLADLGAAAASDIPTTPGDIGAEPAITSQNKLNPSLIGYDSTHAAITEAQVTQIGTNETNISLLLPTQFTVPRLRQDFGLQLIWGGYAKIGNLCIVNMRLSTTADIGAGEFFIYDLPSCNGISTLSAGTTFCVFSNTKKLNIGVAVSSTTAPDGFKGAVANLESSAVIPAGNMTLSGMYLCD